MTVKHYLNGTWVETDQLVVSAFDLAVVRGYGIFDFFRTYNGRPFRINDHLDRLERSAELLGIDIPVTRSDIERLAKEGIATNQFPETGVRIVVTGGVSDDFITPGQSTFMMLFKPVKELDPKIYSDGVKVVTWPSHRSLPEAKTLNYSDAVLATRVARQKGAFEALYTDPTNKRIFEGTTTNFFAVKNGVLLTPPEGVLKGVTRKTVQELAGRLKLEYQEQELLLTDVGSFQEAFITGSSRQIVPVVQIDETLINDGEVGEISRQLKQAFEELVSRN